MPCPALEARNLSKHYGKLIALDRLELSVAPGEIVCLLGANGAGKTTTLNLFLGFTRPTSGEARVAGIDVAVDPVLVRSKLGYVAEVVALYPTLTGAENIEFFSQLAGIAPAAQDRDAVLERLRFPLAQLNSATGNYSKGMRQKLGLAIGLLKGAEAVLLDEPLSGLDPSAANDLVTVLRETATAGTALLISTHDIFRAKELAHSVKIMRQGKLIATVNPEALSGTELEQLYLTYMAERAA